MLSLKSNVTESELILPKMIIGVNMVPEDNNGEAGSNTGNNNKIGNYAIHILVMKPMTALMIGCFLLKWCCDANNAMLMQMMISLPHCQHCDANVPNTGAVIVMVLCCY